MNLGVKLRKIRKEKDLTLDQLAQMTGVAKATLSRIENNVVGGNYGTLRKISDVLGVSLEDLSAGKEKPGIVNNRIDIAILKNQLKDLTKSMIEICKKLGIDISELKKD